MAVQIGLGGRVAMVTGGGRGIGQETARLLARSGAAVAVADGDPATPAATVELITADGGRGVAIRVDVRDPDAATAAVADTVAQPDRGMVMTRAAYDVMREQGDGRIVNLISDSGRVGEPFMVAYGAAKAGWSGSPRASPPRRPPATASAATPSPPGPPRPPGHSP